MKNKSQDLWFSLKNNPYSCKYLRDPLYKNFIFIYMNNIISAGFGFFFWMLAARLYPTDYVGMSSALVSAITIIASLSSFGFLNGLIRFMPKTENKNALINSALTASLFGAMIFCTVFMGGIDWFSPSLKDLINPYSALIFLIFLLLEISVNFTYNGFIALRRADYSLIQTLGIGLRIFLLIPMTFAGLFGIFGSIMIAYILSFFIGVFLLSRLDIFIKPSFNKKALDKILNFSMFNYINDFLLVAVTSVITIVVLNTLGAKDAGYFFIAFSAASPLYAIPNSFFTSVFVEGSHGEPLGLIIRKALRMVVALLVPFGFAMCLSACNILSLFGEDYSIESHNIFILFIISSIFLSINSMFTSIKRVKKEVAQLTVINMFSFIIIIFLIYYLTKEMGLIGSGLGWTIGQGITSIVIIILIFIENFKGKLLFYRNTTLPNAGINDR